MEKQTEMSSDARIYLPLAGTDRLNDLSDGIFAFSMTLLVLGIDIPRFKGALTTAELVHSITSQWRELLTYVVSFLNIGGYWMLHHNVFAYIRYTDRVLVQLNLLFLLTVTFLPYPTALHGEYGKNPVVAVLYGIAIAVNYAMMFVVAWYAYSKPELVVPDFPASIKKILVIRLVLILFLAIMGTILAFHFIKFSFLFFFMVPLSNAIPLYRILVNKK